MAIFHTDEEITGIYIRNADSVYRVAYLYMGNSADAMDVMQEVFVKYIDSDITFKDSGHERAWLITVTKNACRDILKSAFVKKRTNMEELDKLSYTDTYKEGNELQYAIRKLKKNYAVVLYLYYYEEYPVKEIAEILGKKESTIQTWMSAGRKQLKKQLGGVSLEEIV